LGRRRKIELSPETGTRAGCFVEEEKRRDGHFYGRFAIIQGEWEGG